MEKHISASLPTGFGKSLAKYWDVSVSCGAKRKPQMNVTDRRFFQPSSKFYFPFTNTAMDCYICK